MKRFTPFITTALLVAGCASAPPHDPPDIDVSAPRQWSATGESDSLTSEIRWWAEFGDDALGALIEEALGNNYDIKGSLARVDQAAAIAKIAGADLWPQLGAGLNASRQRQNIIGLPIFGDDDVITSRQNTFGITAEASWQVDLFGRIRKGQSAALADFEATAADLAAVRLSIAAQTAKSWFAVVEAREQVALAEATVESFQSSADQVRRRYQEGVRTSLDLRLALSALAQSKALLARRHQQLDLSMRQLEILLGRYPAASVQTAATLPSVTGDVPNGLPSELLIRRPDLISAERRYAATQARVSESRRAFFPSIRLTGSAGVLTTALKNLTDLDLGVWSIAAGLTQPIFQGGRLRANLKNSHSISDQALVAYVQALLRAFAEVEIALVAERTLADQEFHLVEATHQSESARRLAERQYSAGLIDYVTVLETQRQSLNSQVELLSTRRERLNARINLHLSLGGGFEMNENWMEFLQPRPETHGGSR